LKLIRSFPLSVCTAMMIALPALAEEGMWMPEQIPQIASKLKSIGFQGDPKIFTDLTGHPMGAVVSLGGCTASFVSPQGLLVTNHHCVVGALQFNSTPQRNLLKNGYLAKSLAEELSNGPGARVYVTTSVTDVTKEIRGDVDPKLADRERYDLIDRRVKQRVAACEAKGQRCQVASFFEGLKFYEIAQLEIQDVRLVYAPDEGIGVFGGETDNWRWPRHTGDWSFLRAYVGKDGKPAPYSADNVPYTPKHYLKISPAGAKPDDVVFVAGYPGRTRRLQTVAEVKEIAGWRMPLYLRIFEEQLAVLNDVIKSDPNVRLKVASRMQSLNNGLTNQRGVLEGLMRGGSLLRKEAEEQQLQKWISADAARERKYGNVIPALRELQAEAEKTRDRDLMLQWMITSSNYLSAANSLYRLAEERAKSDLQREPGYQERDWPRIREAQERLQRTIDPASDRALLRWALVRIAELPAEQRISAVDNLVGLKPGMAKAEAGKAIDAYLEKLYAATRIADRDYRLSLLQKSTEELKATKDSFVSLAAALAPLSQSIRETEKVRAGAMLRLKPLYMEALLAKSGGQVAPDANSTLRVTYGRVKGVDAKDGLFYKPQTTLAGILEKHTGEGEFDAPDKQIEAIKALREGKKTPYLDPALGSVPVNFLSTVDTTGGNSGSATLNGRGELVGLLFDGTYESVASDYVFDPVKTRSIHVDSRYLLWTMTEVDGATRLLNEMSIAEPTSEQRTSSR
jgi:hypothetical protein